MAGGSKLCSGGRLCEQWLYFRWKPDLRHMVMLYVQTDQLFCSTAWWVAAYWRVVGYVLRDFSFFLFMNEHYISCVCPIKTRFCNDDRDHLLNKKRFMFERSINSECEVSVRLLDNTFLFFVWLTYGTESSLMIYSCWLLSNPATYVQWVCFVWWWWLLQ